MGPLTFDSIESPSQKGRALLQEFIKTGKMVNLKAIAAALTLFWGASASAEKLPEGLVLLSPQTAVEAGLVLFRDIHLTIVPDPNRVDGGGFRVTQLATYSPYVPPVECDAGDRLCSTKTVLTVTVGDGQSVTEAVASSDLSASEAVHFAETAAILDADSLEISQDGNIWILKAKGHLFLTVSKDGMAWGSDDSTETTQRYAEMSFEDTKRAAVFISNFGMFEIGPCVMEQLAPILRGEISTQGTGELLSAMTLYYESRVSEQQSVETQGRTGMGMERLAVVIAHMLMDDDEKPADASALMARPVLAGINKEYPALEQYIADRFDTVFDASRYISREVRLREMARRDDAPQGLAKATVCRDIVSLDPSGTGAP